MLVFGGRLAERCRKRAGSMSNSRRAESSVTIVSVLSTSISGRRACDAGVDGGHETDPQRQEPRSDERDGDLRAWALAEGERHHV